MNDDEMEKALADAVRDYNAPGAVPRNEMWAAIQAARSAKAADWRSARIVPPHRRRWLAVGAVAAALLLVGVAIGRRTVRPSGDQPIVAAVASVATQPTPTPPTVAAGVSSPRAPSATDSTTQMIGNLRQLTRRTGQRVRDLASTKRISETGSLGGTAGTSASAETNSLAYRLVVLQHLAGTEAMITSFRASANRGVMDAEIAGWSRELLSTTRMLETSSATTDPVMKRLLEDLDLVIAQILQYTARGTNDLEELDLIEQSINRRGVITKLRSTLPGRSLSAGT